MQEKSIMTSCKCNCHKYVLHAPSCAKNDYSKVRTTRQAKKTKCTCNPQKPKYPKKTICTACFENHKDNESYESLKWISGRLGRIFG